jgi:uncharacterized membrane protein
MKLLFILLVLFATGSAFTTPNLPSSRSTKQRRRNNEPIILPSSSLQMDPTMILSSSSDQSLEFWITAFASSHIGVSAIRDKLIQQAGQAANSLGLVGNIDWKLPSYWPGDKVGGDQILPNVDTAGRQLYRIGYTMLSFVTLGSAFYYYLQSSESSLPPVDLATTIAQHPWVFAAAVAANTASLTSIVNASPLGLVPGFEAATTQDDGKLLELKRDDTLKFQVRGLTRITRHPLILPVVPWGISNAILLGNRPADWWFFGGLAFYAIAGCAAQDLRVTRNEGSVGTVFQTDQDDDCLDDFFDSTSLVPFGAVFDGRQSLTDVLREVPWLAVALAWPVGSAIEGKMLQWLLS